MSTKLVCDRCGHAVRLPDVAKEWWSVEVGDSSPEVTSQYDLCKKCAADLIDFFACKDILGLTPGHGHGQ